MTMAPHLPLAVDSAIPHRGIPRGSALHSNFYSKFNGFEIRPGALECEIGPTQRLDAKRGPDVMTITEIGSG